MDGGDIDNGGLTVGPSLGAIAAGIAALAVGLCVAQTAAARGESAPADEAAIGGPTQIEEFVVTAQRRTEKLQDIPAAASVFSASQLASAGVETTRDLQTVTSSLSFVQSSFAPQPTIRGIGTRNSNPGDEQVVPIYIDGVYQPFVVGSIFELTDVSQVEVLKGPQGTLLGRNATAGAINIVTRSPSMTPQLELSEGIGSYDERSISGYGAAGSGPIAASLSGHYLQDDGYVRDINTGQRTAALKDVSGRAKVVITPSDHTEVTLSASRSERDDSTSAGYAVGGNTLALPTGAPTVLATSGREVSLTFLPDLEIKQTAYSATIVQHLGFADATSITGYSRNSLHYRADIDLSPVPLYFQDSYQYDRGLSEDLFLSSIDGVPLRWTVGAFYFDDSSGFAPRITNTSIINTRATTDAYAVYAQAAYTIAHNLTLTAGGRYSTDYKCASADNGIGTVRLERTCRQWESFDPSASLEYNFRTNAKLYFRYAQAYKAGLFNAVSYSPTPVNPEKVRSYELGVKSDPQPWLRINVAGYYTQYQNLQVNTRDAVTTAVILQNAAAARIYGLEGDMIIRPIQRLNVRVALSWLNARYQDYENAQILTPLPTGGNAASTFDASGKPLIRVPETTASVSADYTVQALGGAVTFSGNAAYQGAIDWVVDDRLRTPGYTIVNAQVAWRSPNGRYEVDAWGKNLTNVQVPLSIFASALNDTGTYRRPITCGIRVAEKF